MKLKVSHNPKILQIGNYPPPMCGWAIQTKLLVEEIRRRGGVCEVLNVNESRRIKSPDYVDVQNVFDYIYKLLRFALYGYRFQVHVNGQSIPGYLIALAAAVLGRLVGRPIALSWRGGLQQQYFPHPETSCIRLAYQILFHLAGQISCNQSAVKAAIEQYGISARKVVAIPAFSAQYLYFKPVDLGAEAQQFLNEHHPVFFCYVCFRPEYELEMLSEAMRGFRQLCPQAGFIWVGFPSKEMPAVRDFVRDWASGDRATLLLLGNLGHDQFLTLLSRSSAYVRTPLCDGVASSVLESLALGVPVVASENGSRPPGVTTYSSGDAADLCAKLVATFAATDQARRLIPVNTEDNISRTVDWLLDWPADRRGGSAASFHHAA